MSELLFYERVVALNEQKHANLRVKPIVRFGFAREANSVPILGAEFGECAREYPIVFTSGSGTLVPAVLLGLRERENLFVGADGKWDGRYVPAFIRRYPFAPGKDAEGQLLVCIDEAAECFDTAQGEPLFTDGKPTKQLDHALNFMREFQQGAAATEALGARLESLGVLRDADSVAQLNDGTRFRLTGLRVVDENKLRALTPDVIHQLFMDGALGLIHAHLISLGNLVRLVNRLDMKAAANATKGTRH